MTIRDHMRFMLRAAAPRDDRRIVMGYPGSSRSGSVQAAVIALALDKGYIAVSGYYYGALYVLTDAGAEAARWATYDELTSDQLCRLVEAHPAACKDLNIACGGTRPGRGDTKKAARQRLADLWNATLGAS